MASITTIIIIWILAPFIELGIIVGLVIERDKYKRQLQGKNTENTLGKRNSSSKVIASGYGIWPGEKSAVKAEDVNAAESGEESIPVPESASALNTEQVSVSQEVAVPREMSVPQETSIPQAMAVPQKISAPQQRKTAPRSLPHRNTMATAALVVGIIFIVLAGVIFATTTWRIMADGYKVLLIFASSLLFFGASAAAGKWFSIRRTSHAFYLLGSIFLFLSVIAAAYFQVLGSTFVLMGQNRWKVLWVGSLVLEGAFLAGIKWFNDRMYTQASLWNMSVSMLFMAKGFGIGWIDFLSMMTLYAFGLLMMEAWTAKKGGEETLAERKSAFRTFLSRELPLFARLHFWVFGSITMGHCLFSIVDLCSFSFLGGAALLAVALGMRYLAKMQQRRTWGAQTVPGTRNPVFLREDAGVCLVMYGAAVSEFCLYAAVLLGEYVFCSEGILLILLSTAALWDIWKKDGLEIPVLAVCGIAQLYQYLENGTEIWWFVYTLFTALYLFRYYRDKTWKKPALTVSAWLFALAFWGQSFISWPDWIELECGLLPAVLLIWAMGEIWEKGPAMGLLQRISYMTCLGILAWDACITGLVGDALILEVCCLAAFIWGQVKKDVWWTRFAGGLMLLIVVFMTKEFWLSISWWIYLLAAGIGLIIFAAVSEKKKE